ncbi:MAG: divergent polysaccharide deacetylase family protein [Candidatus Sedimenticola endophacoides]
MRRTPGRRALLLLWALLCPTAWAGTDLPTITLIIDDMGNRRAWGEAALEIPGAVTYSFLPHTPHAERLARLARGQGKGVMLHLPMESAEGYRLGPGGLTLHQTEEEFRHTLATALEAVPHVQGVNNHMGSLLTRHPGAMGWLMQGLREHGPLFFIDSRTTARSQARAVALEYAVPSAGRNVFLDNQRDPEAILAQFQRLVRIARSEGHAIGIGHPYPETSQVLRQVIERLPELGVRLVSAAEMVQLQQRRPPWQPPSYPLLKVVKSSKP